MPKEIANAIPRINDQVNLGSDAKIYCHLFGVIGDWYIAGISEDHTKAFGFRNIAPEKEWEMESWFQKEQTWGEFSIENLQKLVNEQFLKELDIRFLIVRDLSWEPKNFSMINIKEGTLNYPGYKN
tara:strand:- start:840 stop:1217 length:378 start_codon:yes stop_codon:yes gene_type:complete